MEPSAQGEVSQSPLKKIPTNDARTRSFLVGNLGCQDGILGCDELTRYFPSGKINIMLITWNMSGNQPPSELEDLLLPQAVQYVPDMYAIALQEAVHGEMKELETRMQTTIGPSHVLLHSVIHGVLCLAIFVRRDLIWFFSLPEDDTYNCRHVSMNMIKTKGAVAISFQFFGTSFLFINSHLPAHESRNAERKEQYEKIISQLDLPRNLRPLKPRYISSDVTARFDIALWFGDLNFRVERSYDEAISILQEIKTGNGSGDDSSLYEPLLRTDQLTKGLEERSIFTGFCEVGDVSFPPTFKHVINSEEYDQEYMRVPSYTDRILVRSKRPGHVKCLFYDSIRGIKTSDHRPVMSLVECEVRPGKDTIPLNAGLFKRDVYVEGLRRRAEENFGEGSTKGSETCGVS